MGLMESDYALPMNIGNPGEFTMLELAEAVLKQVGGSSKLVFQELPQDDPRQRKPDITIARRELGWEPSVPLAEGLEKTIAFSARIWAFKKGDCRGQVVPCAQRRFGTVSGREKSDFLLYTNGDFLGVGHCDGGGLCKDDSRPDQFQLSGGGGSRVGVL